jgi:poly(3-hydroxybutyrate) depolymerase
MRATRKRAHLSWAAIAFLASLTIVLPSDLANSAAGASTVSGASQAVCVPAPCGLSGSVTSYTLANVGNGDGTTSTRSYAVDRPENLTPSQTNRAPAVVVFYWAGNCGLHPAGRFSSLAAESRFIVVYMEVPCGRDNNWDKRNVNSPTTSTPNDEPYVTAVVDAITQCPSSEATPNQCVDPLRIYAAGTSSGGNMTADVMCDAENSSLFRGYLIDSSSMQLFNEAPDCPSPNRSFFVMMALSNYSIDGGLYYDTAPNPHLDVPLFVDWAAKRLGCEGQRVDDAIGSPVASTLRYTYSGPCAYAVAGSPAIVTLGVQNGGHTWSCQDSDAGAPTPSHCLGIPNPPGLTPSGLPYTNGLFIEGEFWNFVAHGVSSSSPAPPLETSPPTEPSPPAVTTTAPATAVPVTVDNNVRSNPRAGPSFVALGDAYSSGEGNSSYLPGTDTARDRCHRSTISYPFIASALLSGGPSGLVFRACGDAKIADFYGVDRRNHEPRQLQWIDGTTRLVSLSVGWADALLPEVLQSCVLDSSRCEAQWRVRAQAAIRTIGAHSLRNRKSLYVLYKKIVSLAPKAQVVVFGYPRLFPAVPPARCGTGVHALSFTRASMEWINSEIRRLDSAIKSAAAVAHVRYVGASYKAFGGHERCTRQPDVNGAITASRVSARDVLDGSFSPNSRGEVALTTLLEGAF